MKKIVFVSIFIGLSSFLMAQNTDKDTPEVFQFPIVGASFGYVIPKGDMGDMFKPFVQVGINGIFKTRKNWLFGVDGNFNFGSNNLKSDFKNELLKELQNSKGQVISPELILEGKTYPTDIDAGILASNQGFSILAKVGKLFPLNKKNPNSGIVIMGGLGMVQNKILFNFVYGNTNALKGDYAKGYDRKTRGVQLSEFLGYWYMNHSSQYFNFYIGLECIQNFSKSVRNYQFDLMGPDTKKYVDLMYNIKIGWMIPLGGRSANTFYYD